MNRSHPRFFVPCLGRAVKPKRLLLPALAPAENAGLRLPRASLRDSGRDSGRALRAETAVFGPGFALFPWPLSLLHDGAEELEPFERAPLEDPAWEPFSFPFVLLGEL